MQQYVEEIITEITMSRDKTPWVAVEGGSDEKLLYPRNFPTKVKLVIGNGWEGVRDIACVDYDRNKKVIGLIDRDYRDHLECQLKHDSIIITDFRDVENHLFNSSALQRVFSEFCSSLKKPTLPDGTLDCKGIRDKIYSICNKLGKFRIYLQKEKPEISLRDINHSRFIDKKNLDLNINTLLNQINGKNKSSLTEQDWDNSQNLTWELSWLNNAEYLSNGHDVMAILAISFKSFWGTSNEPDNDAIEKMFRIGYPDDELQNTIMWQYIVRKLTA